MTSPSVVKVYYLSVHVQHIDAIAEVTGQDNIQFILCPVCLLLTNMAVNYAADYDKVVGLLKRQLEG